MTRAAIGHRLSAIGCRLSAIGCQLSAIGLVLVPVLAGPALAQEPALWPGATYDPAIPTIKAVLGHNHGEVITPPEGVAEYLQALQQAAPTRARLIEYARSWEGRPLWLMVIGSADRIARLEQVKADLQRFADPRRTSAADAERLLAELPVVVWLIHGVHGNEISSSDAALAEAYHLLAAQGDAGVDAVLGDALVLIDPMQNPDVRARFVYQNLLGRAATPDPAPYSAEHDEPWPGGRVNHYLFDMNRDWFCAVAARDARPHPDRPRVRAADHRRPARAGRRQRLLLRAAGRPAQPAHHQGPDCRLGADRPRQRRPLRRARLAVLQSRGLRRVRR